MGITGLSRHCIYKLSALLINAFLSGYWLTSPVVGTAVGAVVGLGIGFGADYVMRKGGVDEFVGGAVSGTVDGIKNVGKKIGSLFSW